VNEVLGHLADVADAIAFGAFAVLVLFLCIVPLMLGWFLRK
jgi:hypothetical protein